MSLAFLAAIPARAVMAQTYPAEAEGIAFSGGLIAGCNMSQVDGDSYSGYHKVGLNMGAAVYVHFNKTFGMSMELLYMQKGCRNVTAIESPSIGTYFSSYTIRLNYAEVPVMLHLAQGKYNYEAGLSYARLIRAHEEVVLDYPFVIDPVASRFEKIDISYIAGINRQLYKGLYGNVRFEYSALSIRPPERIPIGYSMGSRGQFNNIVSFRLVCWL